MTDQPETSQPETAPPGPPADDDQGAALERSAESIREAKDAGGQVAAQEDITSYDDRRAGEQGQDAEGDGVAP